MASKSFIRHIKQKDTIAINIIILALSYNWLGVHVGYGLFILFSCLERTVPDQFATCKTAWKGTICAFINQFIIVVDCFCTFLQACSSQTMDCDNCYVTMITFDCYHGEI